MMYKGESSAATANDITFERRQRGGSGLDKNGRIGRVKNYRRPKGERKRDGGEGKRGSGGGVTLFRRNAGNRGKGCCRRCHHIVTRSGFGAEREEVKYIKRLFRW